MKIEKTINIVGEFKSDTLKIFKDGKLVSALAVCGDTEKEKLKEVDNIMHSVMEQIDRVLQQPV